jgi:hypothetical protein
VINRDDNSTRFPHKKSWRLLGNSFSGEKLHRLELLIESGTSDAASVSKSRVLIRTPIVAEKRAPVNCQIDSSNATATVTAITTLAYLLLVPPFQDFNSQRLHACDTMYDPRVLTASASNILSTGKSY